MKEAEKEDELIGNWYTEEESLGFSAVWCCQVTFNADGTGLLELWSSSPFTWQRLNATTIKIIVEETEPDERDRLIEEKLKTLGWETAIEEDSETGEWEDIIEYVITDYKGVLFDIPYKNLTSKDSSSFWIVPKHLIRSLKTQEKLAHLEKGQGAIKKSEQESQKRTPLLSKILNWWK